MSAINKRIEIFQKALEADELSIERIRDLAFTGIPDEAPALRAMYWKILIGYLSTRPSEWPAQLSSQRALYEEYKRDLMKEPRVMREAANAAPAEEGVSGITRELEKEEISLDDTPLAISKTSEWTGYFKDLEVWADVDKDVRRTRPEMHFFFLPVDGRHVQDLENAPCERHSDVLGRILFLYAKLNPGIRYVQGMNEVLAPIYYSFARDPTPGAKDHAEADAFFCFALVMGECRDAFMKSLDLSHSGIKAKIALLNALLKRMDPELWQHLESVGLNPQFYSLRWIMLLLTQEFEMPDVLRLWDSLLADPRRFEFLLYVCCAMILSVKEALLKGDFAECMQLLQRFSTPDLRIILESAVQLRDLDTSSS